MTNKDLLNSFSKIDDDLIDEIQKNKPKRLLNNKRIGLISLVAALIIIMSNAVWAIDSLKKENTELYIRFLTPEYMNLSLENNIDEYGKSENFFNALKSENKDYIYIAINRLIEYFNNIEIRNKAIKEITPFIDNEDPKISESSSFAVDILSENYKNKNIYHLSDGSVIFTLFNNYSDYGSHNKIWQIKNGELNEFFSFPEPSYYISKIIPSPDGNLFVVETCSNKSKFITIFDPINGYLSPELIGSARVIYGNKQGKNVKLRIDSENYCDIYDISWKDSKTLSFIGYLTIDNAETVDKVYVEYEFNNKDLKINILDK